MCAQGDALAAQAQVVGQQLFQRQPALGGVHAERELRQVGVGRRPVRRQQGVAQGRQLQAFAQARGQQLEFVGGRQALERFADQPRQRLRPQALDGRINRVEPVAHAGVGLVRQQAVARMHHLQPVLSGPRFAVTDDAPAGHELRHLGLAEMEKPQHERAVRLIADRDPQHRPVAEAPLHRLDPRGHLRRRAGHQFGDRGEPGAVLVAQRQVQPQVLQAQQATGRQFFRDLGPDTGQGRQRQPAGRGQGGVADGTATRRSGHGFSR